MVQDEKQSDSSMSKMVVGIIRGSHGLTGKFKVESTSGECEHFAHFDQVTLRNNLTEQTYIVESVEGNVNSLLMKCKGIDTPEQAKLLSGYEILVTKDKACPLNEGEFYIEDLKQCNLVYYENDKSNSNSENGLAENSAPIKIIGTITDVLEGGSGKLLEVKLSESLNTAPDSTDKVSTERTVLVPFRKEFIGTVDIPGKVVQLMHLWILE